MTSVMECSHELYENKFFLFHKDTCVYLGNTKRGIIVFYLHVLLRVLLGAVIYKFNSQRQPLFALKFGKYLVKIVTNINQDTY